MKLKIVSTTARLYSCSDLPTLPWQCLELTLLIQRLPASPLRILRSVVQFALRPYPLTTLGARPDEPPSLTNRLTDAGPAREHELAGSGSRGEGSDCSRDSKKGSTGLAELGPSMESNT